MTIFGSNLAPSFAQAQALPLPTSLNGVSVSMSGLPAPIYNVSPTQVTVQVPYEVQAGPASVMLSVNGQTSSGTVQVSSVVPGIFTDGNLRLVPLSSGHRGDILTLFVTGVGLVSPPVATGAAPAAGTPIDQLPQPVAPVQLTIGSISAPIIFAGIPPGLSGIAQVNFQVPASVSDGGNPMVVEVGGQQSRPAIFTVLPDSTP